MLSRIANSLYWMGRYLERTEHTARYIKVHYYSALDAPLASKQDFIFESILTMLGLDEEYKKSKNIFNEDKINFLIALDEKNPVSIRSNINIARENARGVRDSISSELWEAVNKFYHYVNNCSEKELKKEGIYGFTGKVLENCAIVNGYIDNSLLHDVTWSLIKLGINIERASQITRILYSKVNDVKKIEKQKLGKSIETYQCVTMLKSTEAFDMSRIYYRAVPNMKEALEFLILNSEFPKSLSYNLRHINIGINKISPLKAVDPGTLEFHIGKLYSYYNYMTIEEVEKDTIGFLEHTLDEMNTIAGLIEEKYLSY